MPLGGLFEGKFVPLSLRWRGILPMGFGCIENREDVNVMNYEKEYAKKLTTPEEAVKS